MSNVRKICPKCGRYYTLNDVYCENCGSKLVREEIRVQPVEQPVQRPFDQPVDYGSEIPFPAENPAVNRGKNTSMLTAVIIILASVLLIGIALLILLLIRNDDRHNNEINYKMDAETTSQSDDLLAFANEGETTAADSEIAIETVAATTVTTIPPTEPPTEPPEETTKPKPKKEFIVVSEACSWTEAKSRCEDMGGHLAYITCDEDYNEILSQLSKTQLKYVWLGGRSYISDNGNVTAEWLNGEDFDYIDRKGLWFGSEPSGRDYTSDGQPLEPYIMMWQIKDKWSLNDNSDLALKCYRKERIGFICEIDS